MMKQFPIYLKKTWGMGFLKLVNKSECHACFQTGCLHGAVDVLTLVVFSVRMITDLAAIGTML